MDRLNVWFFCIFGEVNFVPAVYVVVDRNKIFYCGAEHRKIPTEINQASSW